VPEREREISTTTATTWPRPRVLFLSCHLPWPPASGGRRRELELIARISDRFDVHLIVISKTPTEDAANARQLSRFCREVEVFPVIPLPPNGIELGASIPVLRHRAPAASARVAEILAHEGADLVHVEGFYLMQHVPAWVEAPVLLVEQNIEYDLEYQRARAEQDGVTRLDWFLRGALTRTAEVGSWIRATHLATVTAEDREMIRIQLPDADVSVVPDGAEHVPPVRANHVASLERPRGPLVMLLANFGYAPNVDAAQHLCRDILPAIARALPDVHVWLVGNAPPDEVLSLADERVTVTGYVGDVLPYLDAADIVVCPLRIGGGVKLKTIEALRRGKAIVSTQVGAQGLPREVRRALVIADDPHEFAGAVTRLLQRRDQLTMRQRAAARAATRLPTWDASAAGLVSIYDRLLDGAAVKSEVLPIVAGRSA
jgi:glycosyltransferase involved in cell wall biosynthesis